MEQPEISADRFTEIGTSEGYDPEWATAVLAEAESLEQRTTVSTWRPIDLTDALNGVDVPGPALLARTDGVRLLYAARTHGFAGESESCKSWAAQITAAQEVVDGNDVLWLDFEDDERGVVARLLAMMTPAADILQHFIYVRPEEPLRSRDGRITAGGIDFSELIMSRQWSLIVLDGVTEAMTVEGLDINSNSDIAIWTRLLVKRCSDTGAATVMLDHVTKNVDGRGRYAIGGQHKLAGITGAQYVFEVERPFSRAKSDPVTGVIKITVTKDRPGHVRTHAIDGVIARMEVTSYPDGSVSAILRPADDATAPLNLDLASRIADYLMLYQGSSKTRIEESVTGKVPAIRTTLTAMVAAGWVAVEQRGQTHLHTLTGEGKEYFGA